MLYICYNIDVERGQDDPTNSQLDGNCFKYRSGYNTNNHGTQYEEVKPCGGESLHKVENSKIKEVKMILSIISTISSLASLVCVIILIRQIKKK